MWYIVQNILGDNVRSERHQHKRPLYISHYTTTCAIDTLRNHATMRSLTNWCSPQQEAIQLYDSLQKASRVSCLSFNISSLTLMVFGDVRCERISRPEKFVILKSWFAVCPSWGESAENIFDCAASAFATGPLPVDGVCVTELGAFSCCLFQQLFLRRRGFMQTLPFSMLEPRTSAAGSRLQSKTY